MEESEIKILTNKKYVNKKTRLKTRDWGGMDNNTNKKYVIHVLQKLTTNHKSCMKEMRTHKKFFFFKNIKSYKIITHESQIVHGESDENTKNIFFI